MFSPTYSSYRLSALRAGLIVILIGGVILSIWNSIEIGTRVDDYCKEKPESSMCRDGRDEKAKGVRGRAG